MSRSHTHGEYIAFSYPSIVDNDGGLLDQSLEPCQSGVDGSFPVLPRRASLFILQADGMIKSLSWQIGIGSNEADGTQKIFSKMAFYEERRDPGRRKMIAYMIDLLAEAGVAQYKQGVRQQDLAALGRMM